MLFDGDLAVDGDFFTEIDAVADANPDLIAVTGNLTVGGRIALYSAYPNLFVGGFTQAETLEGGDCEIYIHGGVFSYLVHGFGNDGVLETGPIEVPWVINSGHSLLTTAPNALFVDNNKLHNSDADFDLGNIAKYFFPEVAENYGVDVDRFLERLRAGLPVLLPGAKSARKTAP